jgi:hypothetical protein
VPFSKELPSRQYPGPVQSRPEPHSFISCRSQLEQRAPFGVSVIRHTISHTVGLFWKSDQPVAETSTYTEHSIWTQETNIHAPSGIRTRNPSNQAAADLLLRPPGRLDRQTFTTNSFKIHINIISPYTPRSSKSYLNLWFSDENGVCISRLLLACNMLHPSDTQL